MTAYYVYSFTDRRWWKVGPMLAAHTLIVGGIVRLAGRVPRGNPK